MSDQELLLPPRRALHPVAQRWLIVLVLAALTLTANAHSDSYVFRDGDVTYMLGQGMSSRDLKAIQAHHGQQFLWSRMDRRLYVSHDPETMEKARRIVQSNQPRSEQERAIHALMRATLAAGQACPTN